MPTFCRRGSRGPRTVLEMVAQVWPELGLENRIWILCRVEGGLQGFLVPVFCPSQSCTFTGLGLSQPHSLSLTPQLSGVLIG